MTKILSLQISNLLAITAAQIDADGKPVVIGGKNAAGKSSVLAAIEMAVGGGKRIPLEPVHHGAAKAHVILDTDDYLIERHFARSGKSTLKVTAKADSQEVRRPQDLLDKFLGDLTFNPLAFDLMKPKEQREILMRLVGLDFAGDDAKRAKLFEQRTDVNREVKRLDGSLATVPAPEKGLPKDEVSVASLADELEARRKFNASLAAAKAQHASSLDTVASLGRDIERLQNQRNEMQRKAESLAATIAKASPEDEATVRQQITDAETVNAKVRAAKNRTTMQAQRDAKGADADRLTAQIDAIDAAKKAAVEAAKYPIPGLAVDDDGVRLGAVPFSQASQAQRLRASFAIAAANSPKLRVVLIREGALLDDDGLALLQQIAAEYDVQVWIEVVGDRDACTVIIEDGHVQGDEAAPRSDEEEAVGRR